MSGTMRRRVLLGTVVVLALQALLGVAVKAKMVGDMRVAVVTGANRGIGLGLATALAELDVFHVVMACRDLAKCSSAAEIVRATAGSDVHVHPVALDVSDAESLTRFIEQVEERHHRLDVLVNNAGVRLEGWTQAVFDTSMNVHLYGPMHLIEGLAHLYRRGTRIINLSAKVAQLSELSDAYRQAVSNVSDPFGFYHNVKFNGDDEHMRSLTHPTFILSKACLNRATQLYATQFFDLHVSVNAVCPGWVATDTGGSEAPRSVQQAVASIMKQIRPLSSGLGQATGTFTHDGRRLDW